MVGAFLLGLVIISVQTGLLFAAVARIGASLAELLLYVYPALVTATAIILGRERLSRIRLLALFLSLLGVTLLVLTAGSHSINAIGIACGLGAAGLYTVYILVSDRLTGTLDPRMLSTLICAGAAISLFATSAVLGSDYHLEPLGWVWVVGLVLSTALPLIAFLAGLARVGPSTASILSTVEPLTTVVLAFILFGQRLTVLQLLGRCV